LTNTTATLFEYLRYTYQPADADHYSEDEKTLYLTEGTLDELDKINNTKKFLEIDRKTIKPLNYIGVVKAGDITIQIFPKLFKDGKYEKHKEVIARNLLKMLSYSEKLSIREIDSADLDTEELDFFEIFIYLFAKNLNELIKTTQKREYIRYDNDLRFIRERIDTRHYVNPARLHIIPCRYHEFSIDNTLNRILKYTCFLMSRMVKNIDTFRLLRSITNIFDSVTLAPVSVADIDNISFTRLNKNFESFIHICRIFLSHSTLTLQASTVDTFSLLIPMPTLFEEFIAEVLAEDPDYFSGCRTRITPQKYIGTLAKREAGRGIFQMKPDIVIESGSGIAVIDTKYKLLDEEDARDGVSQADMYQMYAYVTKTGASGSMLLYPDTKVKEPKTFFFDYVDKNGSEHHVPLYIKSIPLSYDLTSKDGWREFKERLAEVVHPLFSLERSDQISLETNIESHFVRV